MTQYHYNRRDANEKELTDTLLKEGGGFLQQCHRGEGRDWLWHVLGQIIPIEIKNPATGDTLTDDEERYRQLCEENGIKLEVLMFPVQARDLIRRIKGVLVVTRSGYIDGSNGLKPAPERIRRIYRQRNSTKVVR